jgi:PAS domain S-box-containing protein
MDEKERLEITRSLDLLDTLPEQEFNEIVELAAHICGTPISAFSLIDAERQWFKASTGLSDRETPRDMSFCAHAIQQPGIFLVEDATNDERFSENPLVTGSPGIRFYAGMPLQTPSGASIGALCVIDTVARKMTDAQRNCLTILSRQIETLINLRIKQKALNASLAEIDRKTQELNHAFKENEQLVKSLRGSERLFRSFVDFNPNHIFMKSEDGHYTFYNRSFADHFQIGEHEWIGKTDYDVFPKDLADSFRSHDRLVLEQNEVKSQVFPNNGDGGQETHFKCLKFPYDDAHGNRMIACISVDISSQIAVETKLRRSNRELERLATTDTLTGLQLRRGFEKRIEGEFSRSISNGKVQRSLSVLLIDVDNFKTRNDTFGHADSARKCPA